MDRNHNKESSKKDNNGEEQFDEKDLIDDISKAKKRSFSSDKLGYRGFVSSHGKNNKTVPIRKKR